MTLLVFIILLIINFSYNEKKQGLQAFAFRS